MSGTGQRCYAKQSLKLVAALLEKKIINKSVVKRMCREDETRVTCFSWSNRKENVSNHSDERDVRSLNRELQRPATVTCQVTNNDVA